MRARDYLRVARGFIDNPKRWIKNKAAADEYGNAAYGSSATCWCATGAVEKAYKTLGADTYVDSAEYTRAFELLDAEARERGYVGVVAYNDAYGTTHRDIIDLFDAALRRANS